MAQTLNINNFGSNNTLGATQLSKQLAVGVSSLPVENSMDAVNYGYAVLGVLGGNGAEIVQLQTPTDGQTIPLVSPTKLPHSFGEPLTFLFGNQINMYSAPNVDGTLPPDTNFTKIGTLNLDPTDGLSTYTDPMGSGNYWYKATFYNSTTLGETSLSAATARRGDTTSNYVTLAQIRQEAGFANSPFVLDSQIQEKRDIAQSEANSALSGIYTLPLPQPYNSNVTGAVLLIAAGLLMNAQYGVTNPAMDAKGTEKVTEGRATLMMIQTKTLVLDDANFNDLAIVGSNGPDGWPNADTATADPETGGGGDFMFRITDQY